MSNWADVSSGQSMLRCLRATSWSMATAVPHNQPCWCILVQHCGQCVLSTGVLCWELKIPCAAEHLVTSPCHSSAGEVLHPSICTAPLQQDWGCCAVLWCGLLLYISLQFSQFSCCHVAAISWARGSVQCDLGFVLGAEVWEGFHWQSVSSVLLWQPLEGLWLQSLHSPKGMGGVMPGVSIAGVWGGTALAVPRPCVCYQVMPVLPWSRCPVWWHWGALCVRLSACSAESLCVSVLMYFCPWS